MFLQSSYTTEYLSETNLVLTQEDFGNKLTDLLQPIKSFLHDDQDLLPFSLSRYCGGDSRIAFFAQWFMMTTALTLDSDDLRLKTREYLLKKHSQILNTSDTIGHRINELADKLYLPLQLNIMESKSFSLASDITLKVPALTKYLSRNFYGRVLANELRARSYWLHDDLTIPEYLSLQGMRESYLYVGYPALISLAFCFNQPDSLVNPKAIKWVLLEQILEIISALHQTGRGFELERVMYYDTLPDQDKFLWLSLALKDQKQILSANEAIQAQGKAHRLSLRNKGMSILDTIVLPDKYMDMLKDLLDWALSSNFVEENESV